MLVSGIAIGVLDRKGMDHCGVAGRVAVSLRERAWAGVRCDGSGV